MKYLANYVPTVIILCCNLVLCGVITQDELQRQLINAVQAGDMSAMQQAMASGAHVTYGCPALVLALSQQQQLNDKLIVAVVKRDLVGVQEAIQQRADIHFDNDKALRFAAYNGYLPIVQFLVEQGANVNAREIYTVLMDAAEAGHILVAQVLLECGADIHALNDGALRVAANNGQLPMVEFLIKYGANARAEKVLEGPARWGRWAVVLYLLQHGADRTVLSSKNLHDLYDYIVDELYFAVRTKNWEYEAQILDIITMQELPRDLQQEILVARLQCMKF